MFQFLKDWRRNNRKSLFLLFLQKPHAKVTGKHLWINEREQENRTAEPGVGIWQPEGFSEGCGF